MTFFVIAHLPDCLLRRPAGASQGAGERGGAADAAVHEGAESHLHAAV